MKLQFLPEASAELCEAADYYESRQEGLGWSFRKEIWETVRLIVQEPFIRRERPGGHRRLNCRVFPYYVAYFIRGDLILVAAVAHGHRRPNYWKDRLSP